ncbi:peptidase inhibitor family I36 protein [Agromyces sp. G08B096]|uniref:Peptidase inhibitor family I36 protein n=1 Tax=Agromyces sp. G08B096 TaxID=3156399 RepID=A0AAU7WBL6_9MICO
MHRIRIGAVAGVLLALAASGAAHAAPAGTGRDGRPAPQGEQHCVVEAVELDAAGDPLVDGTAAEPTCFATEPEVDAFLEGRASAARSVDAALASSTLIGRVYQDAGGGGGSLSFWGANACAGSTFGFPSLPAGWNDAISSGGGLNGCWVTMYTDASYGGSRLNCTPWCGGLSSWNDRVSALVFRPAGQYG